MKRTLETKKEQGYVRTTVYFDPKLLREVKIVALEEGRSVSEIIGDITNQYIQKRGRLYNE